MVGPKAAASAVSAMGWPASTLLAGERGHGRNTATATAAKIEVRASKTHAERLSFERVGADCFLICFFLFIACARPAHKYAGRIDTRILRIRHGSDNCQS